MRPMIIKGIGKAPRMQPYQKPYSVKELEHLANEEARRKHPTCPHLAPRTFRDDTSNGLTACIVNYIPLKGGFASRINNQGTFRAKLGRFTPSTSCKGLADVMATYKRLSLHIEIKIGQDRQSEYQRQVEAEVKRSGGYYFIARDFAEFKNWFDQL